MCKTILERRTKYLSVPLFPYPQPFSLPLCPSFPSPLETNDKPILVIKITFPRVRILEEIGVDGASRERRCDPQSRVEGQSRVSRVSSKRGGKSGPSRRVHEVQCVLWDKVGFPRDNCHSVVVGM